MAYRHVAALASAHQQKVNKTSKSVAKTMASRKISGNEAT